MTHRRLPLAALEHTFSTQYIAQWLKKSGVGSKLRALQPDIRELRAKTVRDYFSQHNKELGWSPEETRRWKRAAVLIIHQLRQS